MMLTGDAIDVQEAHRLGMVSKVCPTAELPDRTLDYARRIAEVPTMTALMIEESVNRVKRCRIVKDVLRNTKEGVSDAAMEAACGLHNLRVGNRKRRLKKVAVSNAANLSRNLVLQQLFT